MNPNTSLYEGSLTMVWTCTWSISAICTVYVNASVIVMYVYTLILLLYIHGATCTYLGFRLAVT